MELSTKNDRVPKGLRTASVRKRYEIKNTLGRFTVHSCILNRHIAAPTLGERNKFRRGVYYTDAILWIVAACLAFRDVLYYNSTVLQEWSGIPMPLHIRRVYLRTSLYVCRE